jgi:hypothetical protein
VIGGAQEAELTKAHAGPIQIESGLCRFGGHRATSAKAA